MLPILALMVTGALAPAQFNEDALVLSPYVVMRPTVDDTVPRGGLFVAYVAFDENVPVREAVWTPEGGGDRHELELFASCVRSTGGCVYRSRFPLDEPEVSQIILEASADNETVTSTQSFVDVGPRDDRPPTGLDSTSLRLDQAEPTLTRPEWLYFIDVFAPDLQDNTAVVLLQVFDTSEGDRDLVGQVVTEPWWEPDAMRVFTAIDVPESTTRCYRLVATDLGGNEAESDDLCFDIVLNEPTTGACSHVGASGGNVLSGVVGLLGMLFGLGRRPRRRLPQKRAQ